MAAVLSVCQETVAVLLARGGSKGVPGKNLRLVGGFSLVARSVLAARGAQRVADIYVSTDDAEIAEEARKFGARVIERPADLASDAATSESGWLHALDEIRRDRPDVSNLVLMQCTSPFTTGADIDSALEAMDARGASCALSVMPDHGFLWRSDANGFGSGVNHDHEAQRLRRQDLPETFRESGAFYCVRVADFERVGRRFCGPVVLCPVNHPPVEIDSLDDLALCDAIAESFVPLSPTTDQLRAVKALVMDFDGVLTDDHAFVDQNGLESVRVSRADGLGIERLRMSGRVRLLILSKERNEVVLRRAEKLQVECLQAQDDKVAALDAWLGRENLAWVDVLYLGNDVNDLGPIRRAGLSACPRDAHRLVRSVASWVVAADGGRGFARIVTDALLDAHIAKKAT